MNDYEGGVAPLAVEGRNRKVVQILAAAADLFLANGYDTVSMDAIARRATVSKATMYVYFANKEALFAALIREECGAASARLQPPSLDDMSFEACLRQIADQFIAFFLDPRGLAMHRLIFAEASRFPAIGALFVASGPHAVRQTITDLMAEAAARGLIAIPDPRLGAIQFLSLVIGDLPMECQLGIGPPSAADLETLVGSGIDLFLRGYAIEAA
jgi:TetR/AcrR family transcriptional repressor of mexJK operon